MAEILHQLIGSLSHYLQGFTSQVVQDFSHQQDEHEHPHFCPQNDVFVLWKGNDMSASRGANLSNYVVLKPNKAMHGSGVWMEPVFVFSSHEKTSELSGI